MQSISTSGCSPFAAQFSLLFSLWIHALQHHTEKQSAWSHTLTAETKQQQQQRQQQQCRQKYPAIHCLADVQCIWWRTPTHNNKKELCENKTFTLWKFWLIDSIFDSVNYSHFYARTLQFPLGLLFVISRLNYFSERKKNHFHLADISMSMLIQWVCAPSMEISRFSVVPGWLCYLFNFFFVFFPFCL